MICFFFINLKKIRNLFYMCCKAVGNLKGRGSKLGQYELINQNFLQNFKIEKICIDKFLNLSNFFANTLLILAYMVHSKSNETDFAKNA